MRDGSFQPSPARRLSTGIWDGTDILDEYFSGRLSAQLLSSIIRTDILRRNGYSTHRSVGDEGTWLPVLLEGRAGLVNERCATYMVHGSSESSTLSADTRFLGLCEVMEEISDMANTRSRILREASSSETYIKVCRPPGNDHTHSLSSRRREHTQVVRKLWDWRPLLRRCTLRDFFVTAKLRTLGRIMLPTPVVRLTMALRLDGTSLSRWLLTWGSPTMSSNCRRIGLTLTAGMRNFRSRPTRRCNMSASTCRSRRLAQTSVPGTFGRDYIYPQPSTLTTSRARA